LTAIDIETFIIKSADTDASLIFSSRAQEDFVVEFQSLQLRAVRAVCGLSDPQGVAQLFKDAAAYSRPWPGQLRYQSLEGELTLSATCSSLGAVSLIAELMRIGIKEEWSVIATIGIEYGQLPAIAARAERFFGPVAKPDAA